MSLLGTVRFEILIDEAEIAALARGIHQAVNKPAQTIVAHLAQVGVDYLRTMEERVGHPYLARQWTRTAPALTAAGWMSEIYSRAEGQLFRHPAQRATHVIRGADLLKILEAGAQAHEILPRLAAILAFKSTMGWHTSLFAGTFRGVGSPAAGGRGGLGAFLFRKPPEDLILARHVHHPGVTGNRFIETTRALLTERMALEAEALLARAQVTPA